MIHNLIEYFNGILWGRVMLPLMIGVGVFLTLRLNFPQIRKFGEMFRLTVGKLFIKKNREERNALSPWESASTALASTIGTGSIMGVAFAIKAGGPGTVFWMWVSAFLGMTIKYAEVVLSVYYRKKSAGSFCYGGPMLYLRDGIGSKILSVCFTILCLGVSFCMGNSIQANAIASSLKHQVNIHPYYTAIFLAILVGSVIFGGGKRIASFNARLVPLMSIVYIGCCIAVLVLRIRTLPSIFSETFREAFTLPAATGGVSSYGLFLAMKNGFAKGIFSNEAGLGSAPIAHGSSESSNAAEEGAWGMFEVFFTTIIICTLTALVVLSSDFWTLQDLIPTDLAVFSFENALPNLGGFCVCASTVLFSLSTILGWAFYGEICLRFLFKNSEKWFLLYRILYVLIVFFGSLGRMEIIWTLAEGMNALMAIPNLIGVVFLSNQVKNNFE